MNEKHIRDLAAFNTANLEAVTASGKIWAAGVTDLTNQVAGSAKSSLDESVATFRALAAVKSVKERSTSRVLTASPLSPMRWPCPRA